MTRLKELRLQGFKTFAEPTRFVFTAGVNAVIGPNGSGKSNMADAVRWVLGEQSNRSLRTRRAEDVIFAGSQQRKPLGLAEVILTLNNADRWLPIDFTEVTIGRRAYRTGEGEYLVNGARARLRDVVGLLASGQLSSGELVVVGQGTVDAALSLRPDERRQLFEEAAGVKNLQVRKNEALARLGGARDNLSRVADLLAELRPQMRRLALQARHQQEHDELVRRARGLVLESHRRREQGLRAQLGDARRRAASAATALEAYRVEQGAGREALAAAEASYWAAEEAARASAKRTEATREALVRAETAVESAQARHSEIELALARDEASLAEVSAAGAAAEDAPVDGLDELLAAARDAEQRWQGALAALRDADGLLLRAEEGLSAARQQGASLVAAEAQRREELVAAVARRERLEGELPGVEETERLARRALVAAREEWEHATAEARAAGEAQAAAERAHAAAHERGVTARQRATELAERVAVLQAELAAVSERTEQTGRLGQRLGAEGWTALLDSMRAPPEAWPAIEAAVGGDLVEALVWRRGDLAAMLRDAKGDARLLDERPAPSPVERASALDVVGASRTLADWIGGESVPGLFARVAVAPNLDALIAGWQRLPVGWAAVTEEGDVADGRGILALRGRAGPAGGQAARRIVRRGELASQVEDLERAHADAAEAAASAVARAAAAQRDDATARTSFESAQEGAGRAGAVARAAELHLESAASEVTDLRAALDAARRAEEALRGEARPATALGKGPLPGDGAAHVPDPTAWSRLEAATVAARIARDGAAAERDAARDAWRGARAAADEAERRLAGSRRSRAELAARRTQLTADLEARVAARDALRADLAGRESLLQSARAVDEAATRERAAADAERERLRTELLHGERELGDATARLADLERAAQAAAVEASRHDEALAALGRERGVALESLGELTPDSDGSSSAPSVGQPDPVLEPALAAELGSLDETALEVELRRVRRLVAQIGSVNPFAVEEHREVAARMDEVGSQDADLRAAIDATEELVARLDREITGRFSTAFAAIGARFDEFARLLFAGGSASLELSDEDDGETRGGIEIVVRPPGKRPQRLAMLSGGERALAGVALLFAMLSVNPVPFCILDEVDAALDEANIGRFAEALRRLAATIDFVVITHNRATIEVADTIYGVTMSDAAVSRVVSLRLADLPAEAVIG